MKLVFASGNKNKLQEIQAALPAGVEGNGRSNQQKCAIQIGFLLLHCARNALFRRNCEREIGYWNSRCRRFWVRWNLSSTWKFANICRDDHRRKKILESSGESTSKVPRIYQAQVLTVMCIFVFPN